MHKVEFASEITAASQIFHFQLAWMQFCGLMCSTNPKWTLNLVTLSFLNTKKYKTELTYCIVLFLILFYGTQKTKEDILSRFVLASEQDPGTMDDRYLRDIVLNFLIAGKDTTGNTLTWFFYLLCKNPIVQNKVALEIREFVEWSKEDNTIESFTKRLDEGAISKMHYLQATISETLRLYPAVPVVWITFTAIPCIEWSWTKINLVMIWLDMDLVLSRSHANNGY